MWISRDLSNGRNHHATEDFIGNLVSEQSPGLCPFVQKQCRCLPSRSVDPSFDFFTFSFKIPPFSPSAVSWVLAQLTKAACSTFTSTAKSLAGRDEIIIIYPRNASNDCPVMNEYSLHIFQDASSIPDLCFVPP